MEKKKKTKQVLEYKKISKSNKKTPPKVDNGKSINKTKTINNKTNVRRKNNNTNKKNNNSNTIKKINSKTNKKVINTNEKVKVKQNNNIAKKENLNNEYLANFQKEENEKHYNEFKCKNNKSNKKTNLFIVTLIIFITILAIIFITLMYLPYFKLVNIDVVGNNLTNKEEIVSSSNISLEKSTVASLFDINISNIESIPYIKNVKIKIKNNNTVELEVIERESKYYAYDKEFNLYYKLDNDGRILEKFDSPNDRADELIVNGITFDKDVILGTYINEIDLNRLNNAKIIENVILNKVKDTTISKIILENDLYKLKINDKLEVIFNNIDNIEYNINFLNSMIPQIGITEGTIDFTKENPVFIRYN